MPYLLFFVFPKYNQEEHQIKPEPFEATKDCEWVEEQILKGTALMKFMGVGGMNTRGFGRLEVIPQEVAA